jgi:uncharacterized phiE125 gp8 family phage protein
MSLKLITGPTTDPVSVDEVKDHARITLDAEDALIAEKIVGWRRWVEGFQGRALITQTWEFYLDAFPSGNYIAVPLPPLQSVESVKYYDTDETEATFSSDDYYVNTVREPGRVSLKYGESWPSTTLRPENGVVVKFKAGYGDAATDVPQETREALMMLIAAACENREATLLMVLKDNPLARELLWLNRIVTFA